MSWETIPLGDFLTLKRGYDLPTKHRTRGDVPIVSSSGITGSHNEAKVEGPGVITGRYGTLGEVFYVTQDYWPLNTALYVRDFKGNDPRFTAYFLKRVLTGTTSDKAAVPGVNRNDLHARKVTVTRDLGLQSKIVVVLAAYDDLIENNRRRIQLLEESARLLYEEWFVHLRFPGHEHVKVIDGVPQGWERAALKDLTTKIGSGATPKGGAAAYKSEGTTLIRSLNVYDYRFRDDGLAYIDDSQADRLANVVVEPFDILLNITGASVARCCMAPTHHLPARVNQHVMIIRCDPAKVSPHYVLNFINSHQEKQRLLSIARSGGSTREALTKDVVRNVQVRIPPFHLLAQFDEVASALFTQREILARQNSQLTKAHTLLLPRLMNGEVAL